jgi:putative SOS response-associated peptidase YedK
MFNVQEASENLQGPAWNIKPTNRVPVVLESAKGEDDAVRRLEAARWSWTSSYAKELKTKLATFNARSESVAEKATFRGSVKSKLSILPE